MQEFVKAQYSACTTAVTSRFVTLAPDSQNGQRAALSVIRPLLYDGSLFTIVRFLTLYPPLHAQARVDLHPVTRPTSDSCGS